MCRERFGSLARELADSLRWDLRLAYVKRDVYGYRYHHDSQHGGEY